MNLVRTCAAVAAASLVASVGYAQEARSYVIVTYYRCSQATETRADAIYKETAGIVKKQIDAGHLVASGWGRHWMGGEWRRFEYVGGTDLGTMVDARDAIIAELMKDNAKVSEEFNTVCPSHDDYIWASVASSQAPGSVGQNRARAAMSTYYVCDSREKEADEIVKAAFAPTLNAHVKDGKIASWNWMEHIAGGKYRRLLVIDGADHKSLLNYWNALDAALAEASPALSQRFIEICDSHSDYIWDMGTE